MAQTYPVAAFTATVSGLTVTINTAASHALNGKPLALYEFDWGDDELRSAYKSITDTHSYAAPGTYRLVLMVQDSTGLERRHSQTLALTGTVQSSGPGVPALVLTAPIITPVTSTDGNGVSVAFAATTTGGLAPVTITYSTAAGAITSPATFPVGVTTVNVAAVSADQQNQHGSFTVSVSLPQQQGGGGGGTQSFNMLTPADFTYLGSAGLPQGDVTNLRFGFSGGAISGRVVGSDIHLFATQTADGVPTGAHDNVAEVKYNGVGSRCTLVTNWGDVTKGQRVTASNGAKPMRGLHWDTTTSRLVWAYGDTYNTAGANDPSVGYSTLSGSDNSGVTAYGPWRLGPTNSQKTRGYLVSLPTSLRTATGKTLGVGAPITSGNAGSPWGVMLTAFAEPATATPASVTTNGTVAVPCTDLIYSDINHKQSRPNDTDACGWVHYGESNAHGNQPQNNTTQNGSGCTSDGDLCGVSLEAGLTTFNSIDMITAAAWIDGSAKQGVVFIGQLCRTIPGHSYAGNGRNHVWYGPTQGANAHLCPHGQNGYAYGQSTGEGTTTMLSSLYIYDPADLLAVANGTKAAVSVTPKTDGYDMSLIAHSGSAFPQIAGGLYVYGGAWFEPVSKQLFVTECNAESWASEAQPIVHVFAVNC